MTEKRVLALLLALLLLFSLAPASALAEEPEEGEGGVIELVPATEETPEEAAQILPAPAALPVPAETEAILASGTCGDDLSWTLDGNGLLTVSGTGYMPDYEMYWGDSGPGCTSPWDSYRNQIRSLKVGSGVKSIGRYAFYGYSHLSSVSLADSVVSFGGWAFSSCTALTELTIPAEMRNFSGNWHFEGCNSLTRFLVASGNGWLKSVDGVIYSMDGTRLVACPPGRGGSFTVPSGVTEISSNAFGSCKDLTAVTLPEGLTSIRSNAFQDCSGITSLTLPSTLTSLGGERAFSNCGISTVTLPAALTDFNATTFDWCRNLQEILVESGNAHYKSVDGVVFNKQGTELLAFPNGRRGPYTVPAGTQRLGSRAFWYANVTELSLPDSLTVIGDTALAGCQLSTITIPAGVTTLENNALAWSDSLTEIVFTGHAPQFGGSCFQGLNATVYYPENDSSWTAQVRQDYGGIITWVAGAAPGPETVIASGTSGENLSWTLTKGGQLTISGTGRMEWYGNGERPWEPWSKQIKTLTVEEGVTSVSTCAFLRCTALQSVSLADTVTRIEWHAFCYCSSLTSFTVPASVSFLDGGAFAQSGLENIQVDSKNQNYKSVNGVVFSKDGKTLAAYPSTRTGSYTIPAGVERIGENAFDMSSLSSVTIPEGVTELDYGAFWQCTDLRSVSIPKTVLSIGQAAFCGCSSLASVSMANGLERIGSEAFSSCNALKNVTIPASVTFIGEGAFGWCRSLEEIRLASGNPGYMLVNGALLTKDGKTLLAYPGARAGASYAVPAGVERITCTAFSYANHLESVTFPDSLQSIGGCAFSACKALSSVRFPAGLEQIDWSAFEQCEALREIAFTGPAPQIGSWLFDRVTATAYYPASESSWTDEVRQSCGGTLTWVPVAQPVISTQPKSLTAGEGATAKFTVAASGSDLRYQWQWRAGSSGSWKDSSASTAGYNTATLQVGASLTRNGYQYRCRVSNQCYELYTNAATLTVSEKPVIAVQPKSLTVGAGGTASFTVSAQGQGLSYQWQWRASGSGTWSNSSSSTPGYNTATLQVSATLARNGYQYRCKVSNSKGTVISLAATLTVNNMPVITAQPQSVTAAVGDTAKFTVKAKGTGLSYQWQWSKDGGKTWSNSSSSTPGYNTATLQVSATLARKGYQYRCKVTNSEGTAISSAATLTVINLPVITAQPQSVTARVGETARFTVTAKGTGLSYQWQWSKDGGKTWNNSSSATPGYNTPSLQVTVTASRSGYQYRCKVTNNEGTTISSAAALTVDEKPVITAQPQSVTAYVGDTAKFTVTAKGTGLSYQWQWSKDGGKTWNNSSSATPGYNTATLQVTVAASRGGYQYRCKVTNSKGTVISESATLTVDLEPRITTQPQSECVPAESTVGFTVAASGEGLSYQWQWSKDGGRTWNNSSSATPGYNTATLLVTASPARDGYQYRCMVSNSYGSVFSNAAELTVK